MTNTTASIIREARQLITPLEAWTQGAFARHKNGNPIGPLEENAVCFCTIGALKRASINGNLPFKDYAEAYGYVRNLSSGGIDQFNDTHTHEEVLALLDKAALAAEDAA